jgi:3-deoxy-D-manno-octulosonic-acid transferase
MKSAARSVYNLLFLVFFVVTSPYYFVRLWRRGNWKKGFAQRFGLYDTKIKQSITNRDILWMHAVSVGEMNICLQLIRALEPRLPNLKIMVSTTTTTGMGELLKRMPPHIGKIYYPIDRRKYVTRAIQTIHPDAIVLVESEIWPNFIWRARDLGKPIFLVNARLSDRSFPRYKRFGFLFRELFGSFTAIGAQNATDADRLSQLGCAPDNVHVVGNMKFDAVQIDGKRALDVPALLAQIGVPADAQLLVAGSTHDGEEEILAGQFLRLQQKFPKLFLILVPRHFERARDIGRQLSKTGLHFAYRSEIKPDTGASSPPLQCLLVDSTGELKYFYEHASLVFVGKSISARGGQNPIEPAAFGKATVFGPNMQNFRDVVRILLAGDGVMQVRNATELEAAFEELLANETRRLELGRNGQRVVRENQGATARTADLIVRMLDGRDWHTVPAPENQTGPA